MMKILAAMVTMLLFISPAACRAEETGDQILGKWNTTGDKSQIQIYKEKEKYCAKILSLKEPNWPADDNQGMAGKPKTDRKNPDPKLRTRPIAGVQIMKDFVHAGGNHWKEGHIYDPESGKSYKCKMTLVSTNQLEVRGFVGISLIGRTVTWTRAAAE